MKIKFRLFRRTRNKVKGLYATIKERVSRSLRLEIISVFAACFLFATFATSIVSNTNSKSRGHIEYGEGIRVIDDAAKDIVYTLNYRKCSVSDRAIIEEVIKQNTVSSGTNVSIVDMNENVLYTTFQDKPSKIDIYLILKKISEQEKNRDNSEWNGVKEYYCLRAIEFSDNKRVYLIIKGIPEGRIIYDYSRNPFTASLAGIAVFIVSFFFLTKNKMLYIEELSKELIYISEGDLNYKVKIDGKDELALLAENINYMETEIKNKIDKERNAERTKNELITNVSHDLRTPLTSIMGYIGLLKDNRCEGEEQKQEYLNIAYSKAEKLKKLIEDLFEYTKLTDIGFTLNKQKITMNELLAQIIEELVPIFEENNIIIVKEFSDEKLPVNVDGDKMQRVFENLIMNAVKYSYKPGEIKVKLYKSEGNIMVCIQNKGDNIPEAELPKLFDRLYRVEKSRAESTGGSGLGLAIAKSIVELHEGTIWAECRGEEISFYVGIKEYENN